MRWRPARHALVARRDMCWWPDGATCAGGRRDMLWWPDGATCAGGRSDMRWWPDGATCAGDRRDMRWWLAQPADGNCDGAASTSRRRAGSRRALGLALTSGPLSPASRIVGQP